MKTFSYKLENKLFEIKELSYSYYERNDTHQFTNKYISVDRLKEVLGYAKNFKYGLLNIGVDNFITSPSTGLCYNLSRYGGYWSSNFDPVYDIIESLTGVGYPIREERCHSLWAGNQLEARMELLDGLICFLEEITEGR